MQKLVEKISHHYESGKHINSSIITNLNKLLVSLLEMGFNKTPKDVTKITPEQLDILFPTRFQVGSNIQFILFGVQHWLLSKGLTPKENKFLISKLENEKKDNTYYDKAREVALKYLKTNKKDLYDIIVVAKRITEKFSAFEQVTFRDVPFIKRLRHPNDSSYKYKAILGEIVPNKKEWIKNIKRDWLLQVIKGAGVTPEKFHESLKPRLAYPKALKLENISY